MSLNLTLIPIMEGKREFLSHNILYPTERISFSEAGDSQELLKNIEALKPRQLPDGKKVMLRERNNDPTSETPYGDRIDYLYPHDFSKFRLPKCANKWDRAVLNFIKHLPHDTPILLYWH